MTCPKAHITNAGTPSARAMQLQMDSAGSIRGTTAACLPTLPTARSRLRMRASAEPVPPSSGGIPCATCASVSPQGFSITSCRTVASLASSGIKPTGKASASPVMALRPRRKRGGTVIEIRDRGAFAFETLRGVGCAPACGCCALRARKHALSNLAGFATSKPERALVRLARGSTLPPASRPPGGCPKPHENFARNRWRSDFFARKITRRGGEDGRTA